MGLFSKKVDYDELYRKLSTEKMTSEEARKAEKELKKLAKSGDKRGVIWRPLTSVQIQSVGSVNWATSEFEEAEHKYGICEEYVRVRSLPIVFNLFNESYKKYNDPKGAVFVARAYEHGWGVEKNHEKAVEIIRETESYPKDGTFFVNSDLIKNAYKEITGKEFPDSESSEQKEKQAISGAAKNQNEQPQSDINFKRVEYDGGDVYEGEILNGKRHGHGTYTWADGDTYEGDWKDGKRCGWGKLIQYGKSPSGETYMKYSYDGEWLDGKEHGHGICVEGDFGWEKMDKVFEGEWVNGKRQGRFVWYLTNSKGGRYMDFYEDGKLIETCIPYDESIKTVADARRSKALADGKSSSATPAYTNSPHAAAQDTAEPADDSEWEEFATVGKLHEKILHPELFRDPRDRYLLNSCMYLEPFVDEFHEEFTGGDYAETKEIIAEILGVESGELTENIELRLDFIRGFTEKEYLLAAMYSLAYDERTDLAPYLANLACYLWTDTGDGDYFDPLLNLFRLSGEYDADDSTWLCAILRLQENGNIDEPLKPNDDGSFDDQFADFDDVFGDLLDYGYLPGSDGKMYLSDSDDNGGDETEESDTGDDVLLRYQNGDSYRGAAVGGVREGFGAYFFADGGFYRGCFHANNYEGYGMLDEGNGKVYKGLWQDDKRCGYGEQTYANGEVYRGWWKDNRFHGFGRYEFANGEVCVGEFFGGMRHGISLMRRSNGKWYGKRWNNDDILPSPTGPRVLNTKDGSRYVGAVTERRVGSTVYISRHGFGEVRFSDVNASDLTDCYVGQFVNDSLCGTGVRILTKGDNPYIIASDDFSSNSLPEGECRMIWLSFENGIEYAEYYVGGFYDSKWCGRGTLYLIESGEYQDARLYGLKSGTVICCNTFDRGPDGFASVTDEYGEMRYGRFVDGLWKPNK